MDMTNRGRFQVGVYCYDALRLIMVTMLLALTEPRSRGANLNSIVSRDIFTALYLGR